MEGAVRLLVSPNNDENRREVKEMPNKKQTSSRVAKTASKVLRDGRFSKSSKSVAGSALSQTRKK